jgi:hypothetical protein
MSIDDSTFSSPAKLARIREMFALPEAYVTAVAIWAGGPAAALILATPKTVARGGLVPALLLIVLAIPMLMAAVGLLHRRRSARTLMAYATMSMGIILAATTEDLSIVLVYAHQLALVGLLWLPRIDAVLGERYRDQVIAMVPLVGRRRRALLTVGFLLAMLVTGLGLAFLPDA